MRANKVIWREENGGTTWETSYRCCMMRMGIRIEVIAGGRFHSFLDSELTDYNN